MTTQTATTSPFGVTTWDQTSYDEPAEGPVLARVVVHKTFSGDLSGTSVGEGLLSGSEGAQSYMVLERVTGTLGGRAGTFVLQHGGTVAGGEVVHQWGLVIPDRAAVERARPPSEARKCGSGAPNRTTHPTLVAIGTRGLGRARRPAAEDAFPRERLRRCGVDGARPNRRSAARRGCVVAYRQPHEMSVSRHVT